MRLESIRVITGRIYHLIRRSLQKGKKAVKRIHLLVLLLLAMLFVLCNSDESIRLRVHGVQPKTEVILLEGSMLSTNVPKVISAAKEFFNRNDEFWTEPACVGEGDTYWGVGFARKEFLVVSHGMILVEAAYPRTIVVKVEKGNYSCTLVPGR